MSDSDQRDAVAARLRASVTRLGRALRYQDRDGTSATQLFALATIAREGPLTLGELAASEQVTPPTITGVVGKLEGRGWVERIADPHDRRICRVALTPGGRAHLEENRRRRTEWLGERLAGLTPADLTRLEASLDVLEELASALNRVPARAGAAS